MSSLYESTNWHEPNAFYGIKKALFVGDIQFSCCLFSYINVISYVIWRISQQYKLFLSLETGHNLNLAPVGHCDDLNGGMNIK